MNPIADAPWTRVKPNESDFTRSRAHAIDIIATVSMTAVFLACAFSFRSSGPLGSGIAEIDFYSAPLAGDTQPKAAIAGSNASATSQRPPGETMSEQQPRSASSPR